MRQTIERQSAPARIVNDMIDISRITRGAIGIERAGRLADVARRAAEAAPLIDGAGHKLDMELPGEPVWVEGDLHRLTQLATNLLNNAARYTPKGGRSRVEVARKARSASGCATTGAASSPSSSSDLRHVRAGRPPLKRVAGGLGIGLALVRKLAELHGGSLEARSDGPGKGSEFTLRLPWRKPRQRRRRQEAPGRVRRRSASWSWTTTSTRRARSKCCSSRSGTKPAWCTTAPKRCASRPSTARASCCSTSACRGSTATRWRGGCARWTAAKPAHRRRHRLGAGRRPRESREAGFDVHLVKPVEPRELVRVLDERGGASLH